jgi:L-fuconolactonase
MDRIVDTHVHFWTQATTSWLTDALGPINRDFLPEHHRAASAAAGVSRCVIIEAGATDAENQLIADIAEHDPFVGALILAADVRDPAFGHRLDEWQKLPKFRGVRMSFEGHTDSDIAAQPATVGGLQELARRDLIHDFLPLVAHLDAVVDALEQVPDLRAIIEHYAKPDFAGGLEPAWESAMIRLADATNASVKLSLSPQSARVGEYAARPGQGWPHTAIQPYTDFLLSELGPDRLMWGSDWPVALLTESYTSMLDLHRTLLGAIDEEDEHKLFRTNAEEFYQLEA